MTFEYGVIKSSTTLTYKVVNSEGNEARDKDGNPIEKSVEIKVNGGFLKILINFFRTLLRRVKEETLKP